MREAVVHNKSKRWQTVFGCAARKGLAMQKTVTFGGQILADRPVAVGA